MSLTIEQLANSLALDKDLVFRGRPDDPEMRESISVWLFDDASRFAFPRMGIEAEAANWDERRVQGNFAFADGRVLNGAGVGRAHPAAGPDGRPRVLGAGPLAFTCVEPFRRWTMRWQGPVRDGSVAELIAGDFGTRGTVEVVLDAALEMVTPAWVQENDADAAALSEVERANAKAMGLGYRFEHHFLATGTVRVGDAEQAFSGRGTRVHRQSIRMLTGFTGHCWLSAVFPNGDAFGALVYPPVAGSEDYSHNDAVLYRDGRQVPARVVRAPLLRRIVASGDELVLELESEFGRTVIDGTTGLSTFRIGNPDMGGLNLQQGSALFRYDGQQAWGMVERSSHASLTTIG